MSPKLLLFLIVSSLLSYAQLANASCDISFVNTVNISPINSKIIFKKINYLNKIICPKYLNLFKSDSIKARVLFNSRIEGAALAHKKNMEIEIRPEVLLGTDGVRVLTHELFHLFYGQDDFDSKWLEEGLAEYFSFEFTKNNDWNTVKKTLAKPHVSFTHSYTYNGKEELFYGNHFLYAHYLLKSCGGEDLSHLLGHKNIPPVERIDSYLTQQISGQTNCESFSNSYISYAIARLINKSNTLYFLDEALPKNKIASPAQALQFDQTANVLDILYLRGSDFKLLNASKTYKVWIQRVFPFSLSLSFPVGEIKDWDIVAIRALP